LKLNQQKQVLILYCLHFNKQQQCAPFGYNNPQTLGHRPKYRKVLLKMVKMCPGAEHERALWLKELLTAKVDLHCHCSDFSLPTSTILYAIQT